MELIQASLTRRGTWDGTFRGLKPTAKVSRRYRGEGLLYIACSNLNAMTIEQPKNLELVYTIFCEDVRFEATNHLSLMGVTHQVVVPRLPITMIKFAVVTHWRGEGQYLSEVRILAPDRMQSLAVSQPASFVVPNDGYSDNVTVFVNLNLQQAGNHVVQVLINSTLFAEKLLPVMLADQQPVTQSERVH